ncbi:hypothetical protein [Saccharolobus islandicus]|uniref:hypothetical protein n=1 Tax=Saccharolobus islandicus TaxID=43080 RepID=UPI000376CBDC|nr:hypothetical protein [Sulfolobus islandicus]
MINYNKNYGILYERLHTFASNKSGGGKEARALLMYYKIVLFSVIIIVFVA